MEDLPRVEGTQQQQHGKTRVELAMIVMVYRITGSRYRVDRSSAAPRTHTRAQSWVSGVRKKSRLALEPAV